MVVIVIRSIAVVCSRAHWFHLYTYTYTQPGAWKIVQRSIAMFSSECRLSAGGSNAFDFSRLGIHLAIISRSDHDQR